MPSSANYHPLNKLRKIDTRSNSTSTSVSSSPSRSHTTSPVPHLPPGSTGSGSGAQGGGDYCQSPDSLYPTLAGHPTPRARRRDTSPGANSSITTTVIGMTSTSAGNDSSTRSNHNSSSGPALAPSSRAEIPFIGGGFSAASASSSPSSRPLLPKRGSLSNATHQSSTFFRNSRKTRWVRLFGLVVGTVIVWFVATRWRTEIEPRKKFLERWWTQEEALSQEDLSALLPRPTIATKPPPTKPASPARVLSHTLAEILKLPSTLSHLSTSSSHAGYTAVVHITSSSQLLASHLEPLVSSLSSQSPLPPSRILLLCPSEFEPLSSTLSSSSVSTISYSSETQAPLLALANAIIQPEEEEERARISTPFVLFVDGHVPPESIDKSYARTLLHAFGTREYSSSILTAGGLSFSSPSSKSTGGGGTPNDQEDRCVFPSSSQGGGGGGGGKTGSQKISVPSLPFLFPVTYLLPRSYSSASSSSITTLQREEEEGGRELSLNSPTILQGVPGLKDLPLEVGLSWAVWTKSGIPVYALPIPFKSSPAAAGGGGGGGEGTGRIDGGVCEKLKQGLGRRGGGGGEGDELADTIRRGFGVEKGAGEGLRRISGDRKKGGAGGGAGKKVLSTAKEKNALERAREMKKGSLVLLLSGKEELDAVRKLACRFAAGGADETSGAYGAALGMEEDGTAGGERELRIVVADWEDGDQEWENQENELCHLEITPLSSTSTPTTPDTSISLPLIDMLDSTLDPAPAVVVYLADGSRAREFEEVLRWMGGIFGVRKGGERVSRVRMEKEVVSGGEGGKGRMTVIGIEREELSRADWIGALPIEALRHWHTPRIDVSVITNDRPVSLHRLLLSLRSAHYFGDDVSLALNLEQTADRLTHRLVDDFRWNQGPLTLRHRILLGGLMPAIVESWFPASNDTYGVILEDDVEVSPLFYGWLKFTILKYRYTLAGRAASSRLFGISLYQQKNIELRPEGRQPFDAHKLFEFLSLHSATPYLSQIPCSWGAAYFPEMWREFHSYLALRLSELAIPISEPIVPAIRSNRWPKSWKKYFIELVYLRGYTMLYPNYPGFESLSTNHLEKGTHVHTSQVEEKKKALFEVPLLDVEGSLVDSLPNGGHLPEWDSLPVMDLWGSIASEEELIERGWQTTRQIGSCETLPDLGSVRLKYDARELLCQKTREDAKLTRIEPLPKKKKPPPPDPKQVKRSDEKEIERRNVVNLVAKEEEVEMEKDFVGSVQED